MEARIEFKGDTIVSTLEGQYCFDEAIEAFVQAISACRVQETSAILVDYRELHGSIPATEKMLYVLETQKHYEQYLAEGRPPIRMAYLGSPALVSTYRPGRDLAHSHGLKVEVFTSEEEAHAWLSEK